VNVPVLVYIIMPHLLFCYQGDHFSKDFPMKILNATSFTILPSEQVQIIIIIILQGIGHSRPFRLRILTSGRMNLFVHLVRPLVRGISPMQGLYLHRTTQHISMPRAGLEPAIPVFEQSNTVRVLDPAAIGTGTQLIKTALI